MPTEESSGEDKACVGCQTILVKEIKGDFEHYIESEWVWYQPRCDIVSRHIHIPSQQTSYIPVVHWQPLPAQRQSTDLVPSASGRSSTTAPQSTAGSLLSSSQSWTRPHGGVVDGISPFPGHIYTAKRWQKALADCRKAANLATQRCCRLWQLYVHKAW